MKWEPMYLTYQVGGGQGIFPLVLEDSEMSVHVQVDLGEIYTKILFSSTLRTIWASLHDFPWAAPKAHIPKKQDVLNPASASSTYLCSLSPSTGWICGSTRPFGLSFTGQPFSPSIITSMQIFSISGVLRCLATVTKASLSALLHLFVVLPEGQNSSCQTVQRIQKLGCQAPWRQDSCSCRSCEGGGGVFLCLVLPAAAAVGLL